MARNPKDYERLMESKISPFKNQARGNVANDLGTKARLYFREFRRGNLSGIDTNVVIFPQKPYFIEHPDGKEAGEGVLLVKDPQLMQQIVLQYAGVSTPETEVLCFPNKRKVQVLDAASGTIRSTYEGITRIQPPYPFVVQIPKEHIEYSVVKSKKLDDKSSKSPSLEDKLLYLPEELNNHPNLLSLTVAFRNSELLDLLFVSDEAYLRSESAKDPIEMIAFSNITGIRFEYHKYWAAMEQQNALKHAVTPKSEDGKKDYKIRVENQQAGARKANQQG